MQENTGIDPQSLAQTVFHSYWKYTDITLKKASLHAASASKKNSVLDRDRENRAMLFFHLSEHFKAVRTDEHNALGLTLLSPVLYSFLLLVSHW